MEKQKLLRSGVALVLVGMLTGFWAAAALSGKVQLTLPRLALAAHLNGFFGGLWLVLVALTIPLLRANETAIRRMSRWLQTATWGNWFFTLVASLLGVRGIDYNQDPANNVVAGLLQAFVVIPSIVGSIYWLRLTKTT